MAQASNPRLPAIDQSHFAQVQGLQIPRSSFRAESGWKGTMDVGTLTPVLLIECLPGDNIKFKMHMLGRLATSLYPIMDNLYLDTMGFFCPNRILWKNWERQQGAKDNPTDHNNYLVPIVVNSGEPEVVRFEALSLGDYFGLPTGVDIDTERFPISALPFRMYNKIWNTWIRAQFLQDSVYCPDDDGPDSIAEYEVLRRGKRHDYITSGLTEPQNGPAIPLPFAQSAPVIGTGDALGLTDGNFSYGLGVATPNPSTASLFGVRGYLQDPVGHGPVTDDGQLPNIYAAGLHTNPAYTGVIADLTSASAVTVNVLRQIVTLQQAQELDMRGGLRYIEILKNRFGVSANDDRLQRPEYIGGGSQLINSSAIAQTSRSEGLDTETPHPQANLSAYSVATDQHSFNYSCVEHGFIMVLANVRADLAYQQFIHKMWHRRARPDFYEPIFAHLGEQPVYRSELKFEGDSGDEAVLCYQEPWAEYRFQTTYITGAFRSNYPGGSLDSWHLGLDLDNPTFDANFIEDRPPVSRTQAVTSEVPVLLDVFYEFDNMRPIPTYSTPGLMRL